MLALALGTSPARADEAVSSTRRQTGTKIAYGGLASALTGVALGAFAIGLGNDRPDAARPFYVASFVTLGLGAAGLATGLYLRATSPPGPPDPVALDPVRARHRNERRAGIVLMGLGAAVLVTGIAHGVGAWRDDDLASDHCPDNICDADGARLSKRAHTLALAADMLIGTGAVGFAGGVILFRGGRDTGAQVVPAVGAHQAGAALVGRF